MGVSMKKILLGAGMALTVLILPVFVASTLANEDIYGLRIENINRNSADFYWSTSIETKGSVEYAYTKLPELYNPQAPGPYADILVSYVPLQTRSEEHYVKAHHIKIDNLDLNYDPFVQYTIKSEAFNGDIYTLSGEFVLVDTKAIDWWQTWVFVVFFPIVLSIAMFILGHITREKVLRLWQYLRMHTPFIR
jgi:hypothetical protein